MVQIVPILAVFGTRPEIIKLIPVLRALENDPRLNVIRVCSGQQADLVPGFLDGFDVNVDESLEVMSAGQSLNQLLARLIESLDRVIERHSPAAVIVQGDTTTALAAALGARYRATHVIHVEAGLRTGDFNNPFPEEINRRLISNVSSLHLAPTKGNVETLIREGISSSNIVLTGNPIVDALQALNDSAAPSAEFAQLLEKLGGAKIIALTAHRRENFGDRLDGYLEAIKDFVVSQPDTALVFPVHPNPDVRQGAHEVLGDIDRVSLVNPLTYEDFLYLLKHAWLVLSDSGGVQEEVVTLGKPLLILREITERPEAIESGHARLARTPAELAVALDDAITSSSWCTKVRPAANPFGDGHSGPRIARAIGEFLFDDTGNQRSGSS